MKIVRSDKLLIKHNSASQKESLDNTLSIYRCYVRDLMVLINARWRHFQHDNGNDIVKRVESLIHPTMYRPSVKHTYFCKRYYKFPSYLRRVAIMDAAGQVRSFHTRFDDWLDNGMKNKPPKLTCSTSTFPSLYQGQCIKFSHDLKTAFIKVFLHNDWIWQSFSLSGKTRFVQKGEKLSPLLTLKGKQWALSVPSKINAPTKKKDAFSGKLLSVDVGINTAATCAIVDKTGTVFHRKFFDRTDKDRVYQLMQRIRNTARKQTRHGNKLPNGFCLHEQRRLRQSNLNQVHQISRQIVSLAQRQQCDAIVLENLKYWRPSAGKKRSSMKMKFHNWFHRHLANAITSKAQELGIKILTVYARGTSSFAYDGSGKVTRDRDNYANAKFSNGKRYNADLNASYNIATRGIITLYYPLLCKQQWSRGKQNTCPTTGSPLVLSSLWLLNQSKAG
jgi:IS605 OrfB family transposase